jgi:hypothetical protein
VRDGPSQRERERPENLANVGTAFVLFPFDPRRPLKKKRRLRVT